jgi:hypothetical protein
VDCSNSAAQIEWLATRDHGLRESRGAANYWLPLLREREPVTMHGPWVVRFVDPSMRRKLLEGLNQPRNR